jgi:hypothetical protein
VKLVEVHVEKFRNFDDSEVVAIEPDVTALVGKNESGKTAFLQALCRLKPAQGETFNELDQYPRWLYTKDRKSGVIADAVPITAVFELEADDVEELAERFGEGVVTATRVTAARKYDNETTTIDQDTLPDEPKAVALVLSEADVPAEYRDRLESQTTFQGLETALKQLERPAAGEEAAPATATAAAASVREGVKEVVGKSPDFHAAVRNALWGRLPVFFYFGEYNFLDGRTDLQRVYGPENQLTPGERTALALLRLAGADNLALLEEDYETRKAELEAVSNDLTGETAEYWSQSKDLDVEVDVDKETQDIAEGQRAVARFLEVRVKDRRHGYTDNIDKRSNGFRWFFSFLAAFSEYENKQRVVILLDEPAVALHARAQKDFLRFIDERLAPHHQVIFTTHSPFMVEPGKLNRARLVEDKGAKTGSKVTSDVMSTDADTLFPLQAALGYDIAQTLFIAPHPLLLEGTSDYTYLQVLSEQLVTQGRTGLDERWSLLPAGSVTKITTFLALLGQHLDTTVLVDAGGENKPVADLVRRGLLDASRFFTPAVVTGTKEADTEDLFETKDYLALYNAAMGGKPLTQTELKGTDRIIKRIERARGQFNHGIPADYLLRNRETVLQGLSVKTLDNFEELFTKLNATVPPA